FFFSSRRRHTSSKRDWSSDVCSSDLSDISDQVTASTASIVPITLHGDVRAARYSVTVIVIGCKTQEDIGHAALPITGCGLRSSCDDKACRDTWNEVGRSVLDIVQFNLCVVECVHEKVLAGLPKHCLFHEDATAGLVGIVHF